MSRAKARAPSVARYRWAVASRALAAIGGGYALAAVFAAGAGLALARAGMERGSAAQLATMLAFVVQATAALWAFGCASTRRAWLGIGMPALLLGALAWMLAGAAP